MVRVCCLVGLFFVTQFVFAEKPSYVEFLSKLPYVVTLSGGPIWARAGEKQTFYLEPSFENSYRPITNTHNLSEGEIFLGFERTLQNNWQGQVGLAVAATSRMPMNGRVWVDADPNFVNYEYHYDIQHTHIALKGKCVADIEFLFMPYASASLGVGFNQSNHFTLVSLIPEAESAPLFSSKTSTAFSYNVGVGLQYGINRHWQVGVGYEFTNWGQNQLGLAPGQTLGQGLSLSNLYTQGLQCNLSYLA